MQVCRKPMSVHLLASCTSPPVSEGFVPVQLLTKLQYNTIRSVSVSEHVIDTARAWQAIVCSQRLITRLCVSSLCILLCTT